MISKDEKLKPLPINPVQQEARDCIKLISLATSMVAIDPEKEEENRVLEFSSDRGPNDPEFSFQPTQLNDLAALMRAILLI